ncbi:MAG: DUF1800 family protein [Phycisphaerales bacterium]|nr:DUF1800 family protein [Phycisphaerales bacterium]
MRDSRQGAVRGGRAWQIGAAALAVTFGWHIAASEAQDAAVAASVDPSSAPAGVVLSGRTIAQVGRSRVIAFEVHEAGTERRVFEVTTDPAGVLEVLAPPTLLDGERVGYVRVRGLRAGTAALAFAGRMIRVEVVDPGLAPAWSDAAPRIVSPVQGACVWGEFSVGAEVRVEPRDPEGRLALRTSDGGTIEASRATDAAMGPDRRFVFELGSEGETASPPGPLTLTPIWVTDAGERVGESVTIEVVRPSGDALQTAEGEARHDHPRPQRFGDGRVNVGRAEDASGGQFASNAGAYPPVCVPIRVEQAGWHQVVVRAAGTFAGGELPWVDVYVDNEQFPRTGGSLVSMRWHRVALGEPIWLEAGVRTITPFFANDFYVPQVADRNLMLDVVEVARIGPSNEPDGSIEMPRLEALAGDGAGEAGATGSMSGTEPGAMAGNGGPQPRAMAGAGPGSGAMSGAMPAMRAAMDGPGGAGGPVMVSDSMGVSLAPIRVALDRVLDGRSLSGDLLVEGAAWTAPTGDVRRIPEVALVLNGREVARQRTFAPRFLLDADAFESGANTICLVATAGGPVESPNPDITIIPTPVCTAATPTQTLTFNRPDDAPRLEPLRYLRYGVHDRGWDEASRRLHRNEHYPRERAAIAMYSNATVALSLPEDLFGRFEIGVESLGTLLEGAPRLEVTLISGRDGPARVGVIEAPTWWTPRTAGTADLPPGPKRLEIAFTNDRYQPGVGDRNVWIQSVVLREARPSEGDEAAPPDRQAPVASLLWPPEGESFHMAGAVVVEACDNVGVERVELLIDGRETGIRRWVRRQTGPFVLPLLARDLEPGEHTLAVRAFDEAGNRADTPAAAVTILAEAPADATTFDRATTLLNRFAFGPDPVELADILTRGEEQWLRGSLAASLDEPAELAAMAPGLIWFEDGRYNYGPPRRVIEHAFYTPNPARTRFVLWASNHFSTWIRKVEGDRKWAEHAELARLGPARFQDLLFASARSPAMLRYLDQDTSFAGRLNENYAREIMELHTLGVDGGYSQTDVTRLAGLLTGWTATTLGGGQGGGGPRGFTFRFDPGVSSADATRIVGLEFPETSRSDRYDRALFMIEALAAHPSTARYVSTRLCEAYVCVPAPEDLVDDLAQVFTETGGDMAAMLVAMSRHPSFWTNVERGRMTTPFDYAMRMARTTQHHHPWRLGEYLQLSGFQVFERSTPDGYPTEDVAYADSNAMVQRWSLAQDASGAIANLVPDSWRWDGVTPDRAWAQRVVDALAIGLTGRVLSERSNEAAIDLLLSTEAPVSQRVRIIAPVVAQMPEANLR